MVFYFHLRHGRQSFLFFFFSSAAELLLYYFLLQPSQHPPRADWGGRRRSAEVFCPTALIPTDISFFSYLPATLSPVPLFLLVVCVGPFLFFFFRERTHAGWPDEFHVHPPLGRKRGITGLAAWNQPPPLPLTLWPSSS